MCQDFAICVFFYIFYFINIIKGKKICILKWKVEMVDQKDDMW